MELHDSWGCERTRRRCGVSLRSLGTLHRLWGRANRPYGAVSLRRELGSPYRLIIGGWSCRSGLDSEVQTGGTRRSHNLTSDYEIVSPTKTWS
jgi:hypothetical protein